MYRPQFPYLCPLAFDERDFDHYFDYRNTVLLNNAALAAGGIIWNVPLNLQTDSPFRVRAIQIKGINGADPVVSAQFRDTSGNYLSDDFVPMDLAYTPNSAGLQFLGIVFEPEIVCPAGSVIWMNLKNQTNATQDITKVRVTLSGVKRHVGKRVQCAA